MNEDHKIPGFGTFLEHKAGENIYKSTRKRMDEKILSGDELFDVATEVYDNIPLPSKYSPDEFVKLITDKRAIKKALKKLGHDDSDSMVEKIQGIIKNDVE